MWWTVHTTVMSSFVCGDERGMFEKKFKHIDSGDDIDNREWFGSTIEYRDRVGD